MISNCDYVKRYIYEVTSKVPIKNRKTVKKDLEQKIRDMCGDDVSQVEEVLTKLGDPSKYARKYIDKENSFISGEYYYDYIFALQHTIYIVLSVAVIYALLQATNMYFPFISLQVDTYIDFFSHFFQLLFQYAISGAIGSVGIITILFAIIQKHRKDKNDSTWTPSKLPLLQDGSYCVKKKNCISSIIITIAIALIFLFNTNLLGTYIMQDHVKVVFIELFNQRYWATILFLVLALCALVVLHNITKLITVYYTKFLTATSIIINIAYLTLTFILVNRIPFLNPNFLIDIALANKGNVISNKETLEKLCTTTIPLCILCLVAAITIIDILITLRKYACYKQYKQNIQDA